MEDKYELMREALEDRYQLVREALAFLDDIRKHVMEEIPQLESVRMEISAPHGSMFPHDVCLGICFKTPGMENPYHTLISIDSGSDTQEIADFTAQCVKNYLENEAA